MRSEQIKFDTVTNNISPYLHFCTGCEACVSACPFKAISMKKDAEGFFYPLIDTSCTNCGKCLLVCPEHENRHIFSSLIPDRCFAAIHKDEATLLESSSGGAFTAICQVLGKEFSVYGACFDADFMLSHKCFDNVSSKIGALRKSKYVQSRINDCYRKIKVQLDRGEKVAFSGTPCQVAGLLHFLGGRHDSLVTIELVCHGVASPGIFNEYISLLEQRGNKIVSFFFRDKTKKGMSWNDFCTSIVYLSGKISSSQYNLFTLGFLQRLFLRRSCYSCAYASKHSTRVQDRKMK